MVYMVDVGSGLVGEDFLLFHHHHGRHLQILIFVGESEGPGFKPPLSFFLPQIWPVLPVFIKQLFHTPHHSLNLLNNELDTIESDMMSAERFIDSFWDHSSEQKLHNNVCVQEATPLSIIISVRTCKIQASASLSNKQ